MSLWILKPATLFRTFVHFATTRAREYIYRETPSGSPPGPQTPIDPPYETPFGATMEQVVAGCRPISTWDAALTLHGTSSLVIGHGPE